MTKHLFTFVTIGLLALSVQAPSAQHAQMPPGMTHEEHLKQLQKEAELKARGAAAMGFDQDAAVHHFVLFEDGGAIDVTAGRADDVSTRAAIRTHLQQIARDFSNGLFDKPFATHAEAPAGVPALQQLKMSLTYAYEDTDGGGRVRIRTSDPNALAAVHVFLRYQIAEHKTGDPLSPRKQ
jgi:hypothetical protein